MKPDAEAPFTEASSVKIPFGIADSSSEFIPKSRIAMVLLAVLTIALSVFGYRYVSGRNDATRNPATTVAKLPVSLKPSLNAEKKDPIIRARQLFDSRQLDESIEIYQGLLTKTPQDAHLLNDLGVLFLKKKKLEESEAQLKRSVELSPNCSVCLNNLGYLKTLQGDDIHAEIYLKKAIEVNSAYIDPYFNLGVLYEKNGDYGRSVSAYKEFLQRTKEPESAFNFKLKQHIFSLLEK